MTGAQVTIAMPVYNVERYVERALLSALNQTFEAIEFLLVDDQGSDQSMEVVRRVVADHPRGGAVRIVAHPCNMGAGATRNTAIEQTQTPYLFIMDSDDEIMPNCIELLYSKMQEFKPDYVEAAFEQVFDEKCVVLNHHDAHLRTKEEVMEACFRNNSPLYVQIWNKLYDVEFLRKNKITTLSNHNNEDVLFSFMLWLHATHVLLLPEVTYRYYYTPNSTVDRMLNLAKQEAQAVDKFIAQFVEIIQHKSTYIMPYRQSDYCPLLQSNLVRDVLAVVEWTRRVPDINHRIRPLIAAVKKHVLLGRLSAGERFKVYLLTKNLSCYWFYVRYVHRLPQRAFRKLFGLIKVKR